MPAWSGVACSTGDRVGTAYVVQQRIASGGSAQVYLARDTELDRPVALKFQQGPPHQLQRFRKEAAALARIQHPNVVAVYGFGTHGPARFLAMEFADGEGLNDVLHREIRLPLADVLALGEQMAAGLDAAHRLGVVHRDIKPGNLRVKRQVDGAWTLKIVDFGIARVAPDPQTTVTNEPAPVGTPAYMAPEQVTGQRVDARTDVYATALVLFQLLTGQLPFAAETADGWMRAHAEKPPQPVEDPELFPQVQAVLLAALAKSPTERPASVSALLAQMRAATVGVRPQPQLMETTVFLARQLHAQDLQPALTLLDRHGARVLAVIGREILALFETPQAAVAVLAAQELQHLQPWTIAIDRGLVEFAPAEGLFALRMDGEAYRSVRSLVEESPQPRIVVGPQTWADIREHFEGRGDPLAAIEIVDVLAPPVPSSQPHLPRPPVVGRDLELQLLTNLAERVQRHRQLHVALVAGPLGAGRSTMLRALADRLNQGPMPWHCLTGRCTSQAWAPPFEPFAQMLRAQFGDGHGQVRLSRLELLLRTEADLLADVARSRSATLGTALGQVPVGEPPRPDRSRESPLAVWEAFAAWLRVTAQEKPLTLLVDDLDRARESTLELLEFLLRTCARLPILLVATVETAHVPRMCARLPLPPMRLTAIELTRLSVVPTDGLDALPHLAPRERKLLEALAIVAHDACLPVLTAVLGETPREDALDLLRAMGLVRPEELALTSAVLQQQVLAGLNETTLRLLHKRAADYWLRRPTTDARHAAAIAHHLVAANESDAAGHLVQVGYDALHACAFREALDVFRTALSVLDAWLTEKPLQLDAPTRHKLEKARRQALLGVADCAWLVGETREAEHAAQQLLAERQTHPPDPVARALEILGDVAELRGDYAAAEHAYREAEDVALGGQTEAPSLRGRACHAASRRCMVLWKSGQDAQAEEQAEAALRRYPEADSACAAGRGRLHTSLGHLAARRGEFDVATGHYLSARQCFDLGRDPIGSAMALLSLGNLAYRAKDLPGAEAQWSAAVTACQILDYPHGEALARHNLGTLLLETNRENEALPHLLEAAQLKRRALRLDTLPETLRLIAQAHVALGDRPNALAAAEESLHLAQAQDQPAMVAAAQHLLATLKAPRS